MDGWWGTFSGMDGWVRGRDEYIREYKSVYKGQTESLLNLSLTTSAHSFSFSFLRASPSSSPLLSLLPRLLLLPLLPR